MPAPPLTLTVTASALKCSVTLPPAGLAGVHVPDGAPRVTLRMRIDERTLTASVAAKAVRRAVASIAENGSEGVALVLQGRLAGDAIEDAGLSALPRAPKADKAPVPTGSEASHASSGRLL